MSCASSLSIYCASDDAPNPQSVDCSFISHSELNYEVTAALLCLVAVFGFRVYPRRPLGCSAQRMEQQSSKLTSSQPASKPAVERVTELPREVLAEVARCLPLQDLAALSTTGGAAWKQFGLSADAWFLRAVDSEFNLADGFREAEDHFAWLKDIPKLTDTCSKSADSGQESREAFRRCLYQIDKPHLVKLGSAAPGVGGLGYASVLREACRVLQGLMPCDGVDMFELTCSAAERALLAHNPACEDSARAASTFLQAMHRQHHIISPFQVDRLESAYSSALQLQSLIDVSMEADFDYLETVSHQSENSTCASTSPGLFTIGRPDEEDMHEESRQFELDSMLEELRLQTMSDSWP